MLNKLWLILTVGLLVLSGCGDDEGNLDEPQQEDHQDEQAKKEDNEKVLFEEDGLLVTDVSGWSVGEEEENPLTVNYNHQQLKAIVTVLDTEKDFNQIKDELMDGAGNVELLDQQEGSFSYQSKNKESIRTDVYLSQEEQQTLILSFLTKADVYEDVKGTIKEFRSAVKLQNKEG